MQIEDFRIGDKVELSRVTDLWKRGLRYGVVVKVGQRRIHVQLEKLGRIVTFTPDNIGRIVAGL